ncbi:MAG: DUF89 family protein [Clostridiales bacterium]|nr:DUF89 family protein [Clostridiales bacterium]
MNSIKLNPECIRCLVKKQLARVPKQSDMLDEIKFIQNVLRVIADAPITSSAPELVAQIDVIRRDIFGSIEDYSDIKRYFNQLMLSLEPELTNSLSNSADPLKLAVQYAMTGNYIDFAAMESVNEDKLRELLRKAKDIELDNNVYAQLQNELRSAKRMVFLTDNCGEIVLDKLLVKTIRQQYPLDITIIVRGGEAVNDATLADAEQINLADIAPVIGNGNNIAGTVLNCLSNEARDKIESADLIIAKGQGNFETLYGCGRNIYYLFMCKCKMFAERFGVPQLSGMLLNERKLSIL